MAYPICPIDLRNVGLEPWRQHTPPGAPGSCSPIPRKLVEDARREQIARDCKPFDRNGEKFAFAALRALGDAARTGDFHSLEC